MGWCFFGFLVLGVFFAMAIRQRCVVFVCLILSDVVTPGRKSLREMRNSDWKFIAHSVKEGTAQAKGRTKGEGRGLFS